MAADAVSPRYNPPRKSQWLDKFSFLFLHDLPGLHTSASDCVADVSEWLVYITPSVSTDEADVLLRELRMTVLAHAQDSCFRSLGIGAQAVVDVVVAVKLVVIDNGVWSSQ